MNLELTVKNAVDKEATNAYKNPQHLSPQQPAIQTPKATPSEQNKVSPRRSGVLNKKTARKIANNPK